VLYITVSVWGGVLRFLQGIAPSERTTGRFKNISAHVAGVQDFRRM